MTDMNLPFPMDWREITRLKDNTRIVLFTNPRSKRLSVVRIYPDNTWQTPTAYASEIDARACYANAIAISTKNTLPAS